MEEVKERIKLAIAELGRESSEIAIQANCEIFGLAILNVFQEYPRGQTTVVGRRVIVRPKCALHMQIFSFPLQRLCKIKNLNSYLYMLINGRHTHCLHVPFLFH